MAMMTLQQTGDFLRQMGFQEVGAETWLAFHTIGGKVFPVFVHLRDVYIQVQIHLQLFSTCNLADLYELFTQLNTRRAIGKFALGPEQDGLGRLLVFLAELPGGPSDAYTAPELVVLLLKSSFDLVAESYPHVEAIVRAGCRGKGPSRDLIEKLKQWRKNLPSPTESKDKR